MLIILICLTKIKANNKASKFKVDYRARITKYKSIFNKGYAENWSREIFIINSLLKINPWTYKNEYFNGAKIGR